jgi:subtilisin family serine protease
MKRIFLLIFSTSLFFMACGSPVPPSSSSPKDGIWITHSVIKKIAQEKDFRPDSVKKLSSDVLEVLEQYKENGNSFIIPYPVLTHEEIQPSLAKTDHTGRLFVYIYRNESKASFAASFLPDLSTFLSVDTSFGAIDTNANIRRMDFNSSVVFVQARINPSVVDIQKIADLASVSHIDLVTDPLRSGNDPIPAVNQSQNTPHFPQLTQNGTGITVGVMSDDCGTSDYINGPTSTTYLTDAVTRHAIGSSDGPIILGDNYTGNRTHEGLAMMEIVHSIAPNATIKFATAAGDGEAGIVTFVNNIDALAATSQIIVDDIVYPEEPVFEDGDVALSMERNTSERQTIFISAAGNWSRNVYTFNFTPTPEAVDFGRTDYWINKVIDNNISGSRYPRVFTLPEGRGVDIMLQWDDPWRHSKNDFDIYLVDKLTSEIVRASTTTQNGTQNPYERFRFVGAECSGERQYKIVIACNTTTDNPKPRMKMLIQGVTSPTELPESIIGHPADTCDIACSAMNYDADVVTEDGSSQGLCKLVDVNELPTEGGNRPYLPNRPKPDVSGLNGAEVTIANHSPFFGTSAAAPYVAGIAALMLSAHRRAGFVFKASDFREFLRGGCDPIDGSSNTISGAGRSEVFNSLALWMEHVSDGKYLTRFPSGAVTHSTDGSGRPEISNTISAVSNPDIKHIIVHLNMNYYDGSPLQVTLTRGASSLILVPNSAHFEGSALRLVFGITPMPSSITNLRGRGFYPPLGGGTMPSADGADHLAGNWEITIAQSPSATTQLKNWSILLGQ